MAVKMRLIRMGKKRSAYYRVVVMDGRAPRDGRYIEQIGVYDPHQQPSKVEIDNERAVEWMSKGAQPTEPVRKLLEISGALARFKVVSGQIHTVAAKPAPEPADEPVTEIADEPVTEIADEPVAEIADEPVTEIADEPVTEAADEPVTELPVDQVAPDESVSEEE